MCQPLEIDWLREVLVKYKEYVSDPILDIGARNINGNSRSTCEELFPNIDWIGLDYQLGADVTVLGDAHNLQFADESIGTVINTNTLEHVRNPCKCCEEVYRVLKKGGLYILIVPAFGSPYHHEGGISVTDLPRPLPPLHHYWMVSLECLRDVLFRDFCVLEVGYLKKESGDILNVVQGCALKL